MRMWYGVDESPMAVCISSRMPRIDGGGGVSRNPPSPVQYVAANVASDFSHRSRRFFHSMFASAASKAAPTSE